MITDRNQVCFAKMSVCGVQEGVLDILFHPDPLLCPNESAIFFCINLCPFSIFNRC